MLAYSTNCESIKCTYSLKMDAEDLFDLDYLSHVKLIDFELIGTQFIRLYTGLISLEDWYGDDWDDTPYEHNAGSVYSECVVYIIDIALPNYCEAHEPCEGHLNSPYCKNDMKSNAIPMFVVCRLDTEYIIEYKGMTFEQVISNKNSLPIYMKDTAYKTILKLYENFDAVIMNIYQSKLLD